MSIQLVQAAVVLGGKLSGNEYKVLTCMAAVALDRPNAKGQPARLYYAGWEPLALALGQDVAPLSDMKRRRAQYELVRRALKGLETAGFIERHHTDDSVDGPPRIGHKQTFTLRLSPAETAGHQPQQNSGTGPNKTAGLEPLQNVGNSPAETAGPRKIEDISEDLSEDESHLRSVPVGGLDPSSPHHFIDGHRYPDECVCTLPRRHVNHALSLIRLEDVNAS